jgi:hypothetical protein
MGSDASGREVVRRKEGGGEDENARGLFGLTARNAAAVERTV